VSPELRRLLALAWPQRTRVVLAVALSVVTLGSGIGLMATSAWLISKAALHPSIAALAVAIVGVRFFGLARGVLRYLERLVSHDATLGLLARLRPFVYRALEPLAPARLTSARSGDLLGRLLADVETLDNVYVRVLVPSLSALAVALLTGALLWPRGAALAAAALCGLAAGGLLVPRLVWRLGLEPGRRWIETRAELHARLVDGVQGVAELLAYGHGERHLAGIEALSARAARAQVRLAHATGLGGALTTLCADLATLGVLALAIPQVRAGRLDGVELALVALVTLSAFEAVAALPAGYQSLGATRVAARRLFDLADARPAVSEPAAPAPAGPGRRLEVRGLRFAYDDGPPVLDGIDLTLEPGRLLAVVGPSGCGKSTLAHLLLRFWDVGDGMLWLDGRDVRTLAADDVRARVAFAAQRTHLFAGTLDDNLRLALPEASRAQLGAAARRARLHDFAVALPEGYDTWVGEQGLRLSGGERQRLALARAFLKPAPLLVLDEPTAHLDALTEREVLGEIARAKAEQAVLLITHRLVGLEAADEILVLAGGRVIERGTWSDLVRAGGTFARLVALQRSADVLSA
jgi:ATP-binding cassette subfamily C protein CydC